MTRVVVIPAYQEADRVGGVIRRARAALPDYHVVVMDDGSRDATGSAARQAGAEVLRHPFNLGYGAALQTGYKYALRICPEPEHWGGLSGCLYSEGVSWGKFIPESEGGRFAEVYSDATIAWPLIVRAVIERTGG